MNERATLKDIADLAGVSLTTVSQTLNNKGAISKSTRTRVLEVAEQLGYQQRSAKGSEVRLSTLTMLVKRDPDEKSPNPFHYYVMKGVEEQARQLGLELRFSSLSVDENSRALELPSQLDIRNTDGFLIVGAVVENGAAFSEHIGDRPAVFINGALQDADCDGVDIDNRKGTFEATRHLINQGHRYIGFVGGGKNTHPSIGERREGYARAMREQGLSDIHFADSIILSPEYGAEATKELLENQPQLTALVAATDNVAIGALSAARTLGLSVPEDLSLVGFDDLPGVEHLSPPLSTMAVNKELMGSWGVKLLYDFAAQRDRPCLSVLVSPKLIPRSTVASPRLREVT